MTAEFKKLQTQLEDGVLFEPGGEKFANGYAIIRDARIAHEQRGALREQHAQLIHLHPDDHDGWAVCECGTAKAIRAAAPFLED